MKTLLWASRHGYNKAQIMQIANKIGQIEVIHVISSNKVEIRNKILELKPDCIVGILPVTWIPYILHGVPKNVIYLKPKFKAVHRGEPREEPCKDFDIEQDVLIEPSIKRYEDYITKGDEPIHLRHSGYERIIVTRDQILFINWK